MIGDVDVDPVLLRRVEILQEATRSKSEFKRRLAQRKLVELASSAGAWEGLVWATDEDLVALHRVVHAPVVEPPREVDA